MRRSALASGGWAAQTADVDIRELRAPVEHGPWPPLTHLPPLSFEPLRGARSWTGLTYAQVPGFRPLVLDLHVPLTTRPAPLVMWVHGGGWSEGDRRLVPLQWGQQELFQRLIDAGIAVATPDHRLIGEAAPDDMVRDLVAALRYVRHYALDLGLDVDRVAVWGDSAGAHLASLVGLAGSAARPDPHFLGRLGVGAGRTDVAAIIWWYGASDLTVLPDLTESLWRGVDSEARDWLAMAYSPVSHLRADSPSMLIMHGDQDSLAPLEQATRLHERARAVGARSRLIVVPGADHVFVGADIGVQWQAAIDFLQESLGA